jgi:sugar phosphate isomerase/epimerase
LTIVGDELRIGDGTLMARKNNGSVSSLDNRRKFFQKSAGGLATVLAAATRSRAGTPLSESGQQVREIREPRPKLRIGVFDAAFHDLSTEQLVELIKELKIEAVEIGSGNDPGAAHCDREALLADDAKRRAYAALFESNGILVSAFSCHGNPVHPDRQKAQGEDRVYRQSIDLAAKMGVNRIVCFSGCPGDGTGKHPNWITSLETDEFVDMLKWQWNEVLIPYWRDLGSYARQRNVKVAIEMDLGYSVFNVATLIKLRHAAGDNVGANLDLSGLWHLGVEPTSVVKKLGEEGCIYHMHGKDILLDHDNVAVNGLLDVTPYEDIVHRSWSYADIGFGHDLVVWKSVVEELMAVGYDYVISIEHESPFTSARIGVARGAQALQQALLNRAQIL